MRFSTTQLEPDVGLVRRALLVALLGLATACSSDSSSDPSGSERGPLYAVHSTVDTNDLRTGYLVTTSSIEGDVELDVTDGIEIAGGGYAYAPPSGDYLLVGGSEEPTFTRYELDAVGRLRPGKRVSFANVGVETTYRHVLFVNDEQAYFLDESQIQIVRFNPTTMKLERTIPVDDFECPGESTTFGTPIERPDGFYFPRGCWDLDVTSSGTSLVHFDPDTDTVSVTQESRCMGLQIGFLADSGNAYWFSDSEASVEWTFRRDDHPHDCALRLRADETTFDPDWELDLTERGGGNSVIGAVPAGGSSIWVKVFDPDAYDGTLPAEEIDWGLKAWRWGLLDVESDEPVTLDPDAPLAVFYGYPILVGDRSFSPVSNSDFSRTTLTELARSGIEERMDVQGELRKVFRIR